MQHKEGIAETSESFMCGKREVHKKMAHGN